MNYFLSDKESKQEDSINQKTPIENLEDSKDVDTQSPKGWGKINAGYTPSTNLIRRSVKKNIRKAQGEQFAKQKECKLENYFSGASIKQRLKEAGICKQVRVQEWRYWQEDDLRGCIIEEQDITFTGYHFQ